MPSRHTPTGVTLTPLLELLALRIERLEGDAAWTGPATEAAGLLRPLLHNALKFSAEDAIVEVSISVSESEVSFPAGSPASSPVMVIEVVDHGPGMPEAMLPIIATPFRQADSSETRPHGGLGLGLHAARRSAERLGARLATSTGPNGTRVRVELPLGSDRPMPTQAVREVSGASAALPRSPARSEHPGPLR